MTEEINEKAIEIIEEFLRNREEINKRAGYEVLAANRAISTLSEMADKLDKSVDTQILAETFVTVVTDMIGPHRIQSFQYIIRAAIACGYLIGIGVHPLRTTSAQVIVKKLGKQGKRSGAEQIAHDLEELLKAYRKVRAKHNEQQEK